MLMQGSTPRRAALLLAFFALAAGAPSARAAFDATLVGTVSAPVAGVYTYTYTLTAQADSTPITELDLTLAAPIDPNSVTVYAGKGAVGTAIATDFFGFYNAGDPDIQFYYAGAGLGLGGTTLDIRTFTFTSMFGSGGASTSLFLMGGADPTAAGLAGSVIGPAIPAPEPSSLLMCGLGAIGGLGLLRRNRRLATA